MLRLLIHPDPLPSPASMAFKLYLALLEFLLQCIFTLSHDPVSLPSPKHSQGALPGSGTEGQCWSHPGVEPCNPWDAGAGGDSCHCHGTSPLTSPAGWALGCVWKRGRHTWLPWLEAWPEQCVLRDGKEPDPAPRGCCEGRRMGLPQHTRSSSIGPVPHAPMQ